MLEQILVALVGFLGRSEARKLAHGKKLAAISSRVDSPRKRRFSRMSEVLVVIPIFRQVGLSVQTANGDAGNGRKPRVPEFIKVGARRGANRPLGGFLQGRAERFFRPL